MSVYAIVVSLHIIVAILGLGPLMALAFLTMRPPLPAGVGRSLPPEAALRAFLRLLRLSQVSLGLMFGTGAVMIALVHGAFGEQGWMKVSVALFVVLGAGTGVAQRFLKKALLPSGSIAHVEWAHRLFVGMCLLLATIAWLMQTKPF